MPIACQLNPINENQELKLRQWMAQPDFDLLVKIIDSQATALEVQALADAAASGDFPMKLESGNAYLQKAREFSRAARILRDLSQQRERYKLATVA